MDLIVIQIPACNQTLEIAVVRQEMTEIGTLGVDVTINAARDPVMIEVNARQGLAIQMTNGVGQITRLAPSPSSTVANRARPPGRTSHFQSGASHANSNAPPIAKTRSALRVAWFIVLMITMNGFFRVLWIAALGVAIAGASEKLEGPDSLASLESQVTAVAAARMSSTVAIIAEATGASGSGVIVSDDGLILTAAHVIQGAEDLIIVFPDGREVKGRSLGANYTRDAAMARIVGEDGSRWPAVPLGASRALQAGDWVVALGHSGGFDAARTPPVRFGRVVSKGPGNFLTTDCTLIGGDSGGPLFNLEGHLVAIHSSIGQALENNNHAGVDGFIEDWDRMLAGESWGRLSLNPFANPDMPVLGIAMGQHRRGGQGVPVAEVVPGSPAAAAGVRVGDVILAIDEVEIRDGGELLQTLAKRNAGETVSLRIAQNRRIREIEVVLARREQLYEE